MIVSRVSADQAIASALFVAIALALTAPKSAPIAIGLIAVVCIGLAVVEGFRFQDHLQVKWPPSAMGALLGFSAISLLWSPDPVDAFSHVAFATLVVMLVIFFNDWLSGQDKLRLQIMSRAILAAFVLGTIYLSIEIIWNQALLGWLAKGSWFHTPEARPRNYLSELNRNFAVLILLVWPVLFFVTMLGWSSRWRTVCAVGLLFVVVFITFKSAHESSKLAIVAGAVLALIVKLTSGKVARQILISAWIATTVATLPLTYYAYHSLHLNEASWLQTSAQRRIVIWAEYTRRALEYPLFGSGVRAGDAINRRGDLVEIQDREIKSRKLSRHPHNGFLQVWFELGVVGAVLLMWAAAQVVRDSSRVTTGATTYVAASLAAVLPIFGLCWDIWQTWLLACIGILAVVLSLANRIGLADREAEERAGTPRAA